MARLTQRMKEVFSRIDTFVLATADSDGVPNAVPVSAVKVLDDETILISDQFFGKTRMNLESNPRAAMSFWVGGEGFQVKGETQILTRGSIWEETSSWIRQMGDELGVPLQSKGAVIFSITDIYSVSPGPQAGKKLA